MVQERLTSQKQIILDYLMSIKTHPTAEQVFKQVRKKLPRISQGTVYRILNGFRKKCCAQIIPVKGIAHFDGDVSSHAHFVCESCDGVFDIFDVCSKCSPSIWEQSQSIGDLFNDWLRVSRESSGVHSW